MHMFIVIAKHICFRYCVTMSFIKGNLNACMPHIDPNYILCDDILTYMHK